MDRALAKADAVAMLLHRRCFKSWFEANCIKTICVYSDASPVVGVEIQGMIIDVIFRDLTRERIILPGSTLAYGHAGTISKGVALVWAIWLVAGPEVGSLRHFCDHVISFTTDFGVEMHLLEMPDIADAFVAWVTGAPIGHQLRSLVNQDRRMFRRALRMAGWSHTLGGIMKGVAQKMADWPLFLGFMRHLCKFFRNNTYRQHIARRLTDPPNLKTLLKGFTGSFAKWRYETVPDVQSQLLRLRVLCEGFLRPELFANAQDQEEIRSVMEASKNAPFWRWVAVTFTEVFQRLEHLRRWGMVCDCPEHREERKKSGGKKFIKCARTRQVFQSSFHILSIAPVN